MEKKKYKVWLIAERMTTGFVYLTEEEYKLVEYVTDPSNWDELEEESYSGSFVISPW